MKHVGDITKLSGYGLPLVDCVTGGSPCQDLSVAGLRAGLAGERSGLFMEQIRIVKELRDAYFNHIRSGRTDESVRLCRFLVWENVPGAFSSNGGKDFQTVITEIVRIVEPDSPDVPLPDKRWPHAGCIYDQVGGWSVAWRLHDAQFWGVPQRRKRIALVADFGGMCAPEVLFERKGLRGDLEESGEEGEGTAVATEGSVNYTVCLQGNGIDRADTARCNGRGWNDEDVSYTLNTLDRPAVYSFDSLASNSMKSKNPKSGCRKTEVSKTLDCFDPSPAKNQGGIAIVETYQQTVGTVDCGISKGTGNQLAAQDMFLTVRRITPLECERLQGFPDGWTDIGDWIDSKGRRRKTTDTARYKALGNSIALPFWFWLLRRISAQYARPAYLGSLFDGIGGFPLCWERCNGTGTALRASEIEEFPIAVTKYHFPEVDG